MTKNKKAQPKGIRRKANGCYIADVCVDGVRRTVTCKTLDEAIKGQTLLKLELEGVIIGQTTLQEMRENQTPRRERWTLQQACDYCQKTRWQNIRNKNAVQTQINMMINFFGENMQLDDISTRKIDDYSNHLLKTHKAGSVNTYLAGLSTVLRVAFERDMLDKMPKIGHIKNSAKRIRYLTEDEEAKILAYFELTNNKEMRDLVIVLLDTGLRKGEGVSLKKDNIDMDGGLITVWKTKTDTPRSVPMTKRVRDIIEMRLNRVRPLTVKKHMHMDILFNLSVVSIHYHWERMRGYLGFTDDADFVPHMLRHTCCSRLVQRGAALVKVMKWMGHSNINTTMLYAHLAPDALSDIKELLEAR